MHPNNKHTEGYNFEALTTAHSELAAFVFTNKHATQTIDFADPKAVLALNTAILKHSYGVTDWNIPEGYLCPPIPGRVDYIHHIADVLKADGIAKNIKGLDIGMGANCIYPILAAQIHNWQMVGSDINENAVKVAQVNIDSTKGLSKTIEIRHQKNNANIFESIIQSGEYFNFSMCNPPFYTSEKEATDETKRKQKNLAYSVDAKRNFGGQANELWCNGGEALFLKRMIKQSVAFKNQVGIFSSLVSKSEHLPKLLKLLKKLDARYDTIKMQHGNKRTRILIWKFTA